MEANQIADKFMQKDLKITDGGFREVCNDEIKKTLRMMMKGRNDKLVSNYRKSLAECKLQAAGFSSAMCISLCKTISTSWYSRTHSSSWLPDYASEADRGCDFVVPTTENLIACLLTKSVDDCTEADVKDVAFFYRVALTTVESKLLKSKALMNRKDIWGVLDQPMHWSSSMAYSLMLVEKMSDLTNIAHNYHLKKAGKSKGDVQSTGAEDDESASSHDVPELPPVKKMKQKIRVKGTRDGIVEAFYLNNELFRKARMSKEKVAKMELRKRLIAWEQRVGIIGTNGTSAAQKRKSVEPLQKQPVRKKLPKNTFGELLSMNEEWDASEDKDDDIAFLASQACPV